MKKVLFFLVVMLISITSMAQTGTFKTAALNVDGMPVSIKIAYVYDLKLNPDGKEAAGATAIGKKILEMDYDFIGVSEDFNYNTQIMNQISSLYNQGTHRGGITVTTSTYSKFIAQKTLFDTDGLNLFWKKNLSASNESWTAWNEHYGYTDNGADGLINKGYRYYTLTVASGITVDLYILHMDAEDDPEDNAARASQLNQLAAAIKSTNNKRPIIVMGDTNCRYTRDVLKANFIDNLDADARFTCKDPWIELEYDGIYPTYGSSSAMVSNFGYQKGEVVDKVFYINNTDCSYRIHPNYYLQDISFVNEAGEPLADHWPIVIEWTYYPNSQASQYEQESVRPENPFGDDTEYYLQNVETQQFLKNGGMWGTHAMAGVYGEPIHLFPFNDGTYALQNPTGYVVNGDVYMDTGVPSRWTLTQVNGHYTLVCNDKQNEPRALTGASTVANYGPNRHYVTTSTTVNANDTYQQWDLVSKQTLLNKMRGATEEKPYNATFLMRDANFDRVMDQSVWNVGELPEASKMTYNLCNEDQACVQIEQGNSVAEVYVDKYTTGTYGTQWEVSQQLTNIPNGKYRVTMQGFYRVNYDTSTDDGTGVYLYTRSGDTNNKKKLGYMYDLKQTTVTGETKNGNYMYPNSMAESALFFNAGYYPNESEIIEVTNNTLTIAVGKETDSKGSTVWTCFDNFQLFYLGDGQNHVGDITKDGNWDVTDVTALVNIILGKHDYEAWDYNAADVNGDGEYTVADVTALVNIILGK